jgi:hypothetical protein
VNTLIIDPTQFDDWDNLLLSMPDATFFHSSSWARVLKESYGYRPCYFAGIRNERLAALIPLMEVGSLLTGNRGVSLPFTDYCDSLGDEALVLQELFKQIIRYGRETGWKYIELRAGEETLSRRCQNEPGGILLSNANLELASRDTIPYTGYVGHTLDLAGNEQRIYEKFRGSNKRSIRKAVKEGVEIEISNSLKSVNEFYRLNCMARKRHGLPPQPYSFFEKIHDHILSRNYGFLICASWKGKTIAGAVFFHFGNKAVFKYGASDIAYQQVRANNLVMWEGIRWCCKKGYKSLCFGRTEAQNKGLIQFKSGWGATEHKINYSRYDFKKETFVSEQLRTTGFHTRIFKNTPAPILKGVGALLYRHFA